MSPIPKVPYAMLSVLEGKTLSINALSREIGVQPHDMRPWIKRLEAGEILTVKRSGNSKLLCLIETNHDEWHRAILGVKL